MSPLWRERWTGVWSGLNWLRETLNWLYDTMIVRPFREIKEGLQRLLRVVWDFPVTWREFIRSIERGFWYWYRKAVERIRPLATDVFNLLIIPFYPLLDWWNAHKTTILGFFRNPIGYLKHWLGGLGGFLLDILGRLFGLDPRGVRQRILQVLDFVNTLLARVWTFFTKDIPDWWGHITRWFTNWLKVAREGRSFFWNLLTSPLGTLYRVIVYWLERLGRLIYIVVLEFIDRRW
ncbi:MAG: hypothetical protein DDT19_01724 [Syntrophomonadaceae bacterium]|nr:hypothetical protein [Bacillota bacterium]